jgi:hypothetical protein
LVALGELLGVATIGLHLVASLLRNQRRCDDLAVDAQLGELPVQGIARGTGLVADLEILAAAQLLDELAHGLRAVGELAQAADLSAPFGDSRRDGFSVNIQTEISVQLLMTDSSVVALRLVSLTRPERNPRSRCESVVPS